MFSIWKCKGESDLGLCMTSVLAKRMPLWHRPISTNPAAKHVFKSEVGTAQRHSLQIPKPCIDLCPTLLYISILRTHAKFVQTNEMLALDVCFPQPCSSDDCRFAASGSRLNDYGPILCFHKDQFDEMLCKLDPSEFARLLKQNPTLPQEWTWTPWKKISQDLRFKTIQVSRQLEVGNHRRRNLKTQLSSGTSAGTFACPTGPYRNCRSEAGMKKEPNWYVVPDQKTGPKIDEIVLNPRSREFLFRGFRSTLKWNG